MKGYSLSDETIILLSSTLLYRLLKERGLIAMERLMGMLLVMLAKITTARCTEKEGLRPVTPFLHPVGAPGLIEFMKQVFEAEEVSREQSLEGMIYHAMVRIGDSMIEMGEAHGEAQPMPPALYTYVENLEETYERALKAGATSHQAPTDQVYGARTAWVKDAWGNLWYLASPIQG